ncbi:hypothetical protein PMZ80_007476 [Knufia obscura]|uniref:UBC core domain-containing protein n=1 Tax=Knufia obscura TaxID=1635080 RepID=A0ABR0RIP4_9EURO|nr:hypothetical protein PMZ80_007476 [Knufia obscura]
MPKFQLHDTVVLRRDKTFVGSIEKTSQLESEPLEECLIIAHTHVPTDLVEEFVLSGTPPNGFVFVQFASQEQGSSLIAEEDLILIDRMFDLGDVVKEEGSQMTGTVVDVSSSYVLDPVWQPQITNSSFAAKPSDEQSSPLAHTCDLTCSSLDSRLHHPNPARLIPSVPFEELKRAQDFIEGDYILEQDWLGVVDAVELLVVVRLENNSIVAVAEPAELFIPIPDYDRPLVSLPEFDEIPRPHYVSAMQGWGNTIPPEDLECGQFVVTNRTNLKNGRWLHGVFDPQVKPEGRILMVRCRRMGIQWLMCNAFTPEKHWNAKKPETHYPYENLLSFPSPPEIRRDRRVVLYDPSRHAVITEDRTRAALEAHHNQNTTKNTSSVNLSSNFSVGQQVKFRDPARAAVKYQGHTFDRLRHGRFDRIHHTETCDYDLNEFKIVQSQQRAKVRWQDGSVTEHQSTALTKLNLFEADLMPADIVVSREGMKQKLHDAGDGFDTTQQPLVDFNEMTYFEKPHDLLPAKVGIIQNVDPGEKVAQVRWFANPRIRLTNFGNALGGESRFGPIADGTEDVSLYEVMIFSGLMRKVRDIVVIPPSKPSAKAVSVLSSITPDDLREVDASVTTLSQLEDRHPAALLEWMQHNALTTADDLPKSTIEAEQYKPHHSVDWIGEVCQTRLDGLITVRVNVGDQGRDVLLEHDQILSFVDDHPWLIDYSEDPMDIDGESGSEESDFGDGSDEVLSETVEYEGGQRIDNDPGDDNGESEDETEKQEARPRNHSVVMADADTQTLPGRVVTSTSSIAPANTVLSNPAPSGQRHMQSLASHLPELEPPSFLSLDRDPPSDQFRASENPQTSSAFLKRIAKEHRILSDALPKHEIYVRTYDSRLDLLRCLIIGPLDTPYEYATFLIDLHLGPDFPRAPPTAHFHSWTSGLGRINPNLYEEGKICLSLLGTWPGKSETEGWTEKATILQLLVSLQGLVFVKEPFYNEAGFEGYEQTKEYNNESLLYSEKAYVMGRNFVKHALLSPVAGLEDVLAWTYLPKSKHEGQLASLLDDESGMLKRVIERSRSLVQKSEDIRAPSKQLGGEDDDNDRLLSGEGKSDDETKVFLRPLSKGAFVILNRTLKVLEDIWSAECSALAATLRHGPTSNINGA